MYFTSVIVNYFLQKYSYMIYFGVFYGSTHSAMAAHVVKYQFVVNGIFYWFNSPKDMAEFTEQQ